MADEGLYENSKILISLSFASSIAIGMGLFLYSIFTDYLLYELNVVVVALQDANLIGPWVNTFFETFQNDVLVLIPTALDLLWLLGFVTFTIAFLRSAYYTKREGYLSALGFLTFGTMILLFVMTIFITLSTWFQTEFVARVMPTLVYSTPFFSLYLENVGSVNITIICLAIILNFVDLELAKFNFRKSNDVEANELS